MEWWICVVIFNFGVWMFIGDLWVKFGLVYFDVVYWLLKFLLFGGIYVECMSVWIGIGLELVWLG